MNSVEFPAGLVYATWERAVAAPGTPAKPAALADGLKTLRKLYDAIDFALFDIGKIGSVADAEKRTADISAAIERRFKPIETQSRNVGAAADKWLADLKKARPEPRTAIGATDAASRGADTLSRGLASLAATVQAQLAKRLAELQAADADKQDDPQASQHRLRLRTKVVEMLRIVKNRPDREVHFLICMGNKSCFPYLGPVAGPSQKALLKTVMKGDTGLKYFYGRCVYEESCYTFVGLALPSSLRKKLEHGLLDLTGSAWRVRVRSGTIKDAGEDDDA
jgi:hypothetical protein